MKFNDLKDLRLWFVYIALLVMTKMPIVGFSCFFIVFIIYIYNKPFDRNRLSFSLLLILYLVSYTFILIISGENNLKYILNEFRIVFILILFSVINKYDEKWTKRLDPRWLFGLGFIVIASVGLSRGFFGSVMVIYAGAISFLIFPTLFFSLGGVLSIFLGSGTATLAVLSSITYDKVKTSNKLKVFFLSSVLFILAITYQLVFRGRELNLESIDRGQLYLIFFHIMNISTMKEFLFGFGPGYNFEYFLLGSEFSVIKWILSSFSDHGIYSFLFHSDHLRIILNYGFIFWLLFWGHLFFGAPRNVFIFLFVFSFFNSIFTVPSVLIALMIYLNHSYNTFNRR